MSTDCDSFFDAYGCVFRDCRGYQAPLPLVRLAPVVGGEVGRLEEMAAVGLDRHTRHPSTARLMQLNFGVTAKCASFLQLLSRRRLPIALDPAVHYVKQLVSEPAVCGLVSASSSTSTSLTSYTATLYRNADSRSHSPPPATAAEASEPKPCARVERVVLRETSSLAVTPGTVWCVRGCQEKGGDTAAEDEGGGGTAYVMQLSTQTLFDRGSARAGVEALWALPAPWLKARAAALVECLAGGAVAVVLGGCDVVFADARQPACRSAALRLATPHTCHSTHPVLCSGGVAASHYLVCGFDDGTLRVYDQRRVTSDAPLLELRCGSRIDIRARAVCGAALLLSSTQVGILDLTSLNVHAAQTLADGNVLDAALFDVGDGAVEVCTTSTSGMVYHLRMRQ